MPLSENYSRIGSVHDLILYSILGQEIPKAGALRSNTHHFERWVPLHFTAEREDPNEDFEDEGVENWPCWFHSRRDWCSCVINNNIGVLKAIPFHGCPHLCAKSDFSIQVSRIQTHLYAWFLPVQNSICLLLLSSTPNE